MLVGDPVSQISIFPNEQHLSCAAPGSSRYRPLLPGWHIFCDVFHATHGTGTQKAVGSKVIGRPSFPRISVLTAVWNSEAFLSEAIESVLAQQTRHSWELILVDDGSADRSLRIALEYAQEHSDCIRVLRHPGGANRGISASRNLALRHARGEVAAFLDADDVFLPHHLETQIATLDKHPEAAMVYGSAERWCEPGTTFDRVRSECGWWGRNFIPPLVPVGQRAGLLDRGTLLRWFLEDESMVPCICTVLVRREAALAVGGFETPFRGLYDDQVFHAKLSLRYVVYANEPCVARYRQHGQSCCAGGRADAHKQQEALQAFHRWLLSYTAPPPVSIGAAPSVGAAASSKLEWVHAAPRGNDL